MDCCRVGGQSFIVTVNHRSLLLQFKTPAGLYSTSSCASFVIFAQWTRRSEMLCSERMLFDSSDLKRFQQLLKKGNEEQRRKGSIGSDMRNENAQLTTMAYDGPSLGNEVSYLIGLILRCLLKPWKLWKYLAPVTCLVEICSCTKTFRKNTWNMGCVVKLLWWF